MPTVTVTESLPVRGSSHTPLGTTSGVLLTYQHHVALMCTATTTAHSPQSTVRFGIGFGFGLSLGLGFAFSLTLGSAPSPLTVTSPFYDYYYIFVVVLLAVVAAVVVGFCDHCGILTPATIHKAPALFALRLCGACS